jgi:hypothetical protein
MSVELSIEEKKVALISLDILLEYIINGGNSDEPINGGDVIDRINEKINSSFEENPSQLSIYNLIEKLNGTRSSNYKENKQ